MSRLLKVNREQAIEAAMYVFWAKGYNLTTVDDLQEAIGIQRGSFYFHFKDKRSLFIEVLNHYRTTIVEKRRALVRACPSAAEGIQSYFNVLLEHLVSNKSNSGCLNTNTATELGLTDEEISEMLGLGMNGWQDFWMEILNKGKKQQEFSQSLDVISTAQMLVALTQGLNIVARVNVDVDFLRGIVKSGLSILEKTR